MCRFKVFYHIRFDGHSAVGILYRDFGSFFLFPILTETLFSRIGFKKVSDWFENGISSLVSAPNRTVYYKDGELDVSGAKIEDIVSGDIIDVESSMIFRRGFFDGRRKTVTVNYLGMETNLPYPL